MVVRIIAEEIKHGISMIPAYPILYARTNHAITIKCMKTAYNAGFKYSTICYCQFSRHAVIAPLNHLPPAKNDPVRSNPLGVTTGAAAPRSDPRGTTNTKHMIVGALVLPDTSVGMIEASTTRTPSNPQTRRRSSTCDLRLRLQAAARDVGPTRSDDSRRRIRRYPHRQQ